MSPLEKVAYLKGLIDGQNLADSPEKAKFLSALTDAVESIAKKLDEHDKYMDSLNIYLEQLEDDLTELEEDVDAILDEEFDDECDCGCGHGDSEDDDDDECCCGHHHHHHHHHFEDDEEDFEGDYEAVTCPSCGKPFYYEPSTYEEDEDLLCPHCGKPFKQPKEEDE